MNPKCTTARPTAPVAPAPTVLPPIAADCALVCDWIAAWGWSLITCGLIDELAIHGGEVVLDPGAERALVAFVDNAACGLLDGGRDPHRALTVVAAPCDAFLSVDVVRGAFDTLRRQDFRSARRFSRIFSRRADGR